MANVYYGDQVSVITGNWNTVSNWYSSVGNPCPCGGPTPGAPLGRVPNPATDTVIFAYGFNGSVNVTTGPTGGYTGTVNTGQGGNSISAGTFSGTITVANAFTLSGGTLSGTVNVSYNAALNMSSGTLSGPVNFNKHPTLNIGSAGAFSGGSCANINLTLASYSQLVISGGAYNNSRFIKTDGTSIITIKGGNWSPIASITVNRATSIITGSTLPADPGFGFISGGFTPTYTINPLYPDILGTGLL